MTVQSWMPCWQSSARHQAFALKWHRRRWNEAWEASPVSPFASLANLFGRIDDQPMTRVRAQELARAAGLVVVDGVTKDLDILVVADADTMSGKAKKARKHGVRIIAEPAFWQAIGVQVE